MSVLKDLVKLADHLDRKGLHKESDLVDSLITKMAGSEYEGLGETGPNVKRDDPTEGVTNEDIIEWLYNDAKSFGKESEIAKKLQSMMEMDEDILEILDREKLLNKILEMKPQDLVVLLDGDKLLEDVDFRNEMAEHVSEELKRSLY